MSIARDTFSLTIIAGIFSLVVLYTVFPVFTFLILKTVLVLILYVLAAYQLLLTVLCLRARRKGLIDEYDTWIDTSFSTGVFFLLATVIVLS